MTQHDEREAGRSAGDDTLLDTIGTAFSKLRRRTMSVPVDPPVASTDLRRDLVLTAVEESAENLTVNALAATLMMERSVASRVATWCVGQGLIERVASQTDARSVTLRLTKHGRRTLRHSRHQQRQAFEYITRDWTHEERLQFARLLHKYAQSASGVPPATRDDEPR